MTYYEYSSIHFYYIYRRYNIMLTSTISQADC
jgi:hypothetical protein